MKLVVDYDVRWRVFAIDQILRGQIVVVAVVGVGDDD